MKNSQKFLGLLIIAAVMATPSATSVFAEANHSLPPAPSSDNLGSCHAHHGTAAPSSEVPLSSLPNVPSPHPSNYHCCLTGHNAAVLKSSCQTQPAGQTCRSIAQEGSDLIAASRPDDVLSLPFAKPPCITALRI